MSHDHSHGHAHGHSHGPRPGRAGERHRTRLLGAFVIIGGFFFVELIYGFITNSLALLSDAAHMFTDVLGIGMALAAIQLASRFEKRSTKRLDPHTFGLYRLEILAAFVNALLLVAVAAWVVFEAVQRLGSEPEVLGRQMLVVAVLGLVANIVAFLLLREGAQESINVEGAYLEVLADLVGSVGVIIAALAIEYLGWTWADAVVGALIGLWIVPRSVRLGLRAVRVLLQAAPEAFDLDGLATELAEIPGVVDVHDLHVWKLTSDMDAASAHLMTSETVDAHGVLDQARTILADRHGIEHGTFQVEPESHHGCHDVDW